MEVEDAAGDFAEEGSLDGPPEGVGAACPARLAGSRPWAEFPQPADGNSVALHNQFTVVVVPGPQD